LGTRWENIENWGTFWGHDRTTLGRRGEGKIPLPLPPQKEKNWTIQECVLFYFILFLFLIQFLPLPLVEAKNGDQQFSKSKIQATNG